MAHSASSKQFVNAAPGCTEEEIRRYSGTDWQHPAYQHRRKLDLYEHRLRAYQAGTQFIGKVVKDLSPDVQDFSEFWRSTAEADFLFGSNVRDYLEELATRAASLRRWSNEYRDNRQVRPEGYDYSRVVEGQHEERSGLPFNLGKRGSFSRST